MSGIIGFLGGMVLANAVAVAYVAYIATASTASKRRTYFLEHSNEDVVKKLIKVDRAPSPEKLKTVYADMSLLRKNVETGWHTTEEQAAAVRLVSFVLSAHTSETLDGLLKLVDDAGDKMLAKIEKLLDSLDKDDDAGRDDKDKAA